MIIDNLLRPSLFLYYGTLNLLKFYFCFMNNPYYKTYLSLLHDISMKSVNWTICNTPTCKCSKKPTMIFRSRPVQLLLLCFHCLSANGRMLLIQYWSSTVPVIRDSLLDVDLSNSFGLLTVCKQDGRQDVICRLVVVGWASGRVSWQITGKLWCKHVPVELTSHVTMTTHQRPCQHVTWRASVDLLSPNEQICALPLWYRSLTQSLIIVRNVCFV